jgi:hypothetical protein
MSRRSAGDEMMENLAVGCMAGLFLAIWAGIAALIAGIVKSSQQTPEEQLRNMGAQPIFGAQIVGQPCPTCGEQNEDSANICFRCGGSIAQIPRTVDSSGTPEFNRPASIKELGARPSILVRGKTINEVEFVLFAIATAVLMAILFIGILTHS